MDHYDIFISYRREDGAEFAEGLALALKSKGYRVFFDKNNIKVGTDFPRYISSAVKSCREFIAIVTPSYCGRDMSGHIRIHNENDWVCKEIELALSREQVTLFSLAIDCHPPRKESLPAQIASFADKNFIVYDRSFDTYERLIDRIELHFSEETKENAIIGAVSDKLAHVEVNDAKMFNVICKDITKFLDNTRGERILQHIIEKKDSNGQYYYDQNYRYVVFYTLFSSYRRTHQTFALLSLVETFGSEFIEYPFTQYVYVEYWHTKFNLETDEIACQQHLLNAIVYARRAIERLPENNGILHSFSLSVAMAEENGLKTTEKDFSLAVELIHRIMKATPDYAMYYCTYARLLACRQDYSKALANLKLAQALEKPGHPDWILRISQYQKHEVIIRFKQAAKKD